MAERWGFSPQQVASMTREQLQMYTQGNQTDGKWQQFGGRLVGDRIEFPDRQSAIAWRDYLRAQEGEQE